MPDFTMQATATIPSDSGVTRDAVQNTFTFFGGGSGNTPAIVAAAFHQRPIDYYIEDFGEAHPLGWYMGQSLERSSNVCSVTWREVDLTTGNLGAIVRTDMFTLPAADAGSAPLPREVSVCSSFHGDLTFVEEEGSEGDRPASRLRGRRFVGPLNTSASDVDSTPLRPASDLVDLLVLAEQNIADGGAAVVWSRAGQSQSVVIGGFIDNEFDTQRRRGETPTSRTTWVA